MIISLLQVGSVEMSGSSSTLIKRCPSRVLLCSLLPTAVLLLSLLQVINGIHNNNDDNLCGLLPLSYWRSFIESSKAKYQMEKNKQKFVSQDFSRKWLDEGYMVLSIAPLQSWNFTPNTPSVLASGLTWACTDLVHVSQLVWAPVCAADTVSLSPSNNSGFHTLCHIFHNGRGVWHR